MQNIHYNLARGVFNMIKEFENFDIIYFKDIEDKISRKVSVSEDEINYFLSYIVYYVRCKLPNRNKFFENECDLSQSIICHYLNDLDVANYPNMTLNCIVGDIIGHSFIVATFNVSGSMVNYLIDPTYIQFFKEENCSDKRYIMYNNIIIRTPDPGYFIKKEDRDTINIFNYYGYGILDDKLAKIYGDSFYNTKTMVNNKIFREMMAFVYINSFKKGNEKLSKSKEELIENGYYLDFSNSKSKKNN